MAVSNLTPVLPPSASLPHPPPTFVEGVLSYLQNREFIGLALRERGIDTAFAELSHELQASICRDAKALKAARFLRCPNCLIVWWIAKGQGVEYQPCSEGCADASEALLPSSEESEFEMERRTR